MGRVALLTWAQADNLNVDLWKNRQANAHILLNNPKEEGTVTCKSVTELQVLCGAEERWEMLTS